MDVKLIAVTHTIDDAGPEAFLERAGRLCYGSPMGDTAAFLQARIAEGHLSLVEHATASFYVAGISRACSHQLVRHRLCSFSQRSQRYLAEDNAQFVVPPSIAAHPEAAAVYAAFLDEARRAYARLRALGVRKEDARFVLPNATTTELIISLNFREALHILRLRISPQAQWEIRELCVRMLEELHRVAPAVFGPLRAELQAAYPQYWKNLDRARGEAISTP